MYVFASWPVPERASDLWRTPGQRCELSDRVDLPVGMGPEAGCHQRLSSNAVSETWSTSQAEDEGFRAWLPCGPVTGGQDEPQP